MRRNPYSAHDVNGPRDYSHLVAISLGTCGIVNGDSYSNLASALSLYFFVLKVNFMPRAWICFTTALNFDPNAGKDDL